MRSGFGLSPPAAAREMAGIGDLAGDGLAGDAPAFLPRAAPEVLGSLRAAPSIDATFESAFQCESAFERGSAAATGPCATGATTPRTTTANAWPRSAAVRTGAPRGTYRKVQMVEICRTCFSLRLDAATTGSSAAPIAAVLCTRSACFSDSSMKARMVALVRT